MTDEELISYRDDVREFMIAENEADTRIFQDVSKELISRLARGRKAVEACKAFESLISESKGVYGLHLNGDPSPWEELLEGGRFEEWLIKFSEYQQQEAADGD